MLKSDPQRHELTLPTDALAAMRDALAEELGTEAMHRVLRRAGAAVGGALAPLMSPTGPEALRALPGATYWRLLSDLLAGRGWGQLQHSDLDLGVGALDATNWAEARATDSGASEPSCQFSVGMLAALLRYTAGADIAVVETECRAAGDERCRFVFGPPARVAAARPAARSAPATS